MARCRYRPPSVQPRWPDEHDGTRPLRTTRNSLRAAASSIASPTGPFLNLPRELRDEIYSYLVPSHTTLDFAAPTWKNNAAERFFNVQYDMSSFYLAIFRVCQQICTEASALLYGTNRFKFCMGRRPASGYFYGNGPSPFNTARALPRSTIGQIKMCAVRVYMCTYCAEVPPAEEMCIIRDWLEEMCKLFERGRQLREIEVELDHHDYPRIQATPLSVPLDVEKFQTLLEPLKRLKGLKSAIVKGTVTNTYRAELKEIMEGGAAWGQKKRKAEMDKEKAITKAEKQPVNCQESRSWDF